MKIKRVHKVIERAFVFFRFSFSFFHHGPASQFQRSTFGSKEYKKVANFNMPRFGKLLYVVFLSLGFECNRRLSALNGADPTLDFEHAVALSALLLDCNHALPEDQQATGFRTGGKYGFARQFFEDKRETSDLM